MSLSLEQDALVQFPGTCPYGESPCHEEGWKQLVHSPPRAGSRAIELTICESDAHLSRLERSATERAKRRQTVCNQVCLSGSM